MSKPMMVGQRYGRLVVTAIIPCESGSLPNSSVECACDCGGFHKVKRHYLTRGKTKSCGCIRKTFLRTFNKTRRIQK